MASVYVHFPWCLAKCPYCDFVSYAAPRDEIDHRGYADAVLAELESRAMAWGEAGHHGNVRTIFFGGGTPSLWSPAELGRVLARIKTLFQCPSEVEVTVECNPTSLDEAKARALVEVGVNRLSIGTQSLREEQLKFLGRLHDPGGALAAIDGAKAAGVPRISTDLIFGVSGQPPQDAADQAIFLADRGMSHLSCYQLTIEAGTQFGELAKRGRLPLADDGLVAESFLAIDEALSARGFGHYEISNYAKPGEEARHNLGYWRGEEYLGLGCGAFGQVSRTRYRNAIDPRKYVSQAKNVRSDLLGEGDGLSMSSEALTGEMLLRERIMLGLRLATGFDLEGSARELGVEAWPKDRAQAAEKLIAGGRLVREQGRVFIPKKAWLWTDDIAARLF